MKKNSKSIIVQEAIKLFNTQGYSGTSLRDIAKKANVNIANIAYYFDNKQGLLEFCFTTFFEQYLSEMEEAVAVLDEGAMASLRNLVSNLIYFQCKNIHLTRFIIREMSIDSQIVREIMTTYSLKEKFYFQKILERGIEKGEFKPHSSNYLIIQLKSLLNMPFLYSHYLSEVLHVLPHERYFADQYIREIFQWMESSLFTEAKFPEEIVVS
ncbi:MAG: forespore capture DNA-binding protein RefZ [Bacillota bacterium]|nr:forespore capture DNA-binding protein RefZ [Bacillota bacterium]MDP4170795.1 forespore capture DNA-binding protein RefZ [Bacillota bacterium]